MVVTTTQIMNPSVEAKTVRPTTSSPRRPRPARRASTATPPARPARPNHFGTLRARNAASDEPKITVAAQAAAGAASCGRGRSELDRLQRDAGGAAEDDDAGEEAVRVEADQPRAQAGEEPEERERGAGEERRAERASASLPSRNAGNASAT